MDLLRLNHIPRVDMPPFVYPPPPCMGIWVVSTFWLLWIMLPRTLVYRRKEGGGMWDGRGKGRGEKEKGGGRRKTEGL